MLNAFIFGAIGGAGMSIILIIIGVVYRFVTTRLANKKSDSESC